MKIQPGQVFTFSGNYDYNEVIENWGTMLFNPDANVNFHTTKNVINYGVLISKPKPGIVHDVYFKNVRMQNFVGGGQDVIDSDVGWWNMGAGRFEVSGDYKTPFTNAAGGIPAGALSFPVHECHNWQPGDKIVINPLEKPEGDSRWWNNDRYEYEDKYIQKLERRTVVAVNGKTITINAPLKFEHAPVRTQPNINEPRGLVFTPHIINETRNFKIHGAENARAHIFCCAHLHEHGHVAHKEQKHLFENAEVFQMGVRKIGGHRYKIPEIVTGRYAFHLHHAGDGTKGSLIQNNSFHDNGGRCFVPHKANGITFKRNSISFNLGEACWWDFQEMSHEIDIVGNVCAGILWDGVQLGGTSILLGIGDNCKCNHNWLIYGNQGDVDGSGGYQWTADNESVWKFFRNFAVACVNPNWTWQNSGRPHSIEFFTVINCFFGLTHGAYGNGYVYTYCQWYNSRIKVRASGGVTGGSSFINCIFDGMNILGGDMVIAQTSAVGGKNQFIECTFKNGVCGVGFDLFRHNDVHAQPRQVELINCKWENVQMRARCYNSAGGPNVPDSYIRIQEGNNAYQLNYPNTWNGGNQGVFQIGKFAADNYGDGDGVRARYYQGINKEKLVLELVEAYMRHDDWRIDLPKMPGGVYYKLNTGPFSVEYTAKLEALFTGGTRFKIAGASGFRMWLNGQTIIDSPGNKHDNSEFAESAPVHLVAGQRYDMRVEVYEPGDEKKGVLVYWWAPQMGGWWDIQQSQLYSGVPQPEAPGNVPTTPVEPKPEDPKPEQPKPRTISKVVVTYSNGVVSEHAAKPIK